VLLVNTAAVVAVGTPLLQFEAVFQTPVVVVVFQVVWACTGIASTSPALNAASSLIFARLTSLTMRMIRSSEELEALDWLWLQTGMWLWIVNLLLFDLRECKTQCWRARGGK
jgi:hypothetical protein